MKSENFEQVALGFIAQRRLPEAKSVLQRAIAEKPQDWRPVEITDRLEIVHVWDEDEFRAYCEFRNSSCTERSIIWKSGSYSHAYYWLAHISVEDGNLEAALFLVDCGLTLEPDHPELLCERGNVLQLLKRHEEALRCYQEAESARAWAPATQKGRALRGQAFSLIELGQLDDAHQALHRSLEFEPDNANARNELAYLEQLRRKEKEPPPFPWFMHSILHPPCDPLTLNILKWVEGLPSIPGPQTVGRENYSRIREAFKARGWDGFEAEFKKLFPFDHPDHRQMKENLLREPFFSPTAHQRLYLLFEAAAEGGEDSIKRAMESIRQNSKQRKPTS